MAANKFVCVFYIFFITLCGFAKDLEVYVIKPPQVELPGVEQIAVLDFDAADKDESGFSSLGRSFAGYLIGNLANPQRGIEDKRTLFASKEGRTLQEGARCNIYTIIEQTQLESLLQLHAEALSGIRDPEAFAIQVGKLANAQMVIMGSIIYSTSDVRKKESAILFSKEQVDVLERSVTVMVNANIVDTETGKIIVGKTISQNCKTSRRIDGSGKPLDTAVGDLFRKGSCANNLFGPQEIAQELLKECSAELASYIAPTFEAVKFPIEKVEVAKEIRDKEEEARKNLEEGDVDDAYPFYNSLLVDNPYTPELHYNLGVLNEVVGNFEAAGRFYQAALQLKRKEDRYQEAADRISGIMKYPAVWETMPEYVWMQDIPVEFVELKNDCQIRMEPENGSEVIASVPKGVTLELLARDGSWCRVKLIDGKEGFVSNDDVK